MEIFIITFIIFLIIILIMSLGVMLMNKNIKVGVIGLGVGEAHIKSYKKIKNLEIQLIEKVLKLLKK